MGGRHGPRPARPHLHRPGLGDAPRGHPRREAELTDAGLTEAGLTEAGRARRRYDSTLRRQRAGETRDRIVAAGCEILLGSSIRDWRALTIRAVAERAGVNERTVYRHFVNERGVRDAVMRRLEEQAGIDLAGLQLEHIADVTARIVETVSSHPLDSRPPLDPTLTEAGRRQRDALLRAVTARTAGWPEADRAVAAAMFDVLWGVSTYERLVADWQLDPERALGGITWVIELIAAAVRGGRRPPDGRVSRS
ncbi:MAG TPA: helix-turn-helix domain-containing protein [Acidimicrobiales bacterium]|nr:helix-turn-helix domain-containing protein [Acidimicrobiales bacterium]